MTRQGRQGGGQTHGFRALLVAVSGVAAMVVITGLALRRVAAHSVLLASLLLIVGAAVLASSLLYALPRLRRWATELAAREPSGSVPWLQRAWLLLGGLLLPLLLLELALRLYAVLGPVLATEPVLHRRCGDCPYLYELDPRHNMVGEQGLRDDPVTLPKPPGTYRVLLLGDSVTYGPMVSRGEIYADLLERDLNSDLQDTAWSAEVVNAGVSGYTTYNERRYFEQHGQSFEPDLTVLALVFNDVANPRLHWGYTRRPIGPIPAEAIPNPAYDRQRNPPWSGLAVFRFVRQRLRRLGEAAEPMDASGSWPVRITGEDRLGIDVLMDSRSPEWVWLRRQLDQLHRSVQQAQSRFLLMVLPLAYQLDPDYPFLPQERFAELCQERNLACLDLLPAFRTAAASGGQELFLGRRSGYSDYWHLSERGHRIAAQALRDYLLASDWLPPS